MQGAQAAGEAVNTGDSIASSSLSELPASVTDKVGRNDLCPCGSGKKYKQCHGKDLV